MSRIDQLSDFVEGGLSGRVVVQVWSPEIVVVVLGHVHKGLLIIAEHKSRLPMVSSQGKERMDKILKAGRFDYVHEDKS